MTNGPTEREARQIVYFGKGGNAGMFERVKVTWKHIHLKGKQSFDINGGVALDSYSKWTQSRVKVLLLPYKREEPLYPQPMYDPLIDNLPSYEKEVDHLSHDRTSSKQSASGESEVVPMACLKNAKVENIKLQADLEDKNIELSFALQEKRRLWRENREKDYILEGHGSCEQSNKSRIEKSNLTNIQDMALLKSKLNVRSLQVA